MGQSVHLIWCMCEVYFTQHLVTEPQIIVVAICPQHSPHSLKAALLIKQSYEIQKP